MPQFTNSRNNRSRVAKSTSTRRFGSGTRGEKGGSLVEFALVFPVFLFVIIGIIEFSFVLAQNSEIRHLAREGARIASVDNLSSQDITNVLCDRLGVIDPANFRFRADGVPGSGGDPEGSAGAVGIAEAMITDVRTITGWFDDIFLPGTGTFDLSSSARFYVEAPADAVPVWWSFPTPPLACST